MAVERISAVSLGGLIGNTGSVGVTVPTDATYMLVLVTGYNGTANFFSGGSMTIGGNAMTVAAGAADDDNTKFYGCAFWRALPPTGSQTLAWDWAGTEAPSFDPLAVAVFYKGVDTADPVRTSVGVQFAAPQYSTGSIASQNGDIIAVAAFGFTGVEASVDSWSNATEVSEFAKIGSADLTLAEHAATGAVTIATLTTTGYEDGGIMAVVLKAAAAGENLVRVRSDPNEIHEGSVRSRALVRFAGGAP